MRTISLIVLLTIFFLTTIGSYIILNKQTSTYRQLNASLIGIIITALYMIGVSFVPYDKTIADIPIQEIVMVTNSDQANILTSDNEIVQVSLKDVENMKHINHAQLSPDKYVVIKKEVIKAGFITDTYILNPK